jgi:hypothetical protein
MWRRQPKAARGRSDCFWTSLLLPLIFFSHSTAHVHVRSVLTLAPLLERSCQCNRVVYTAWPGNMRKMCYCHEVNYTPGERRRPLTGLGTYNSLGWVLTGVRIKFMRSQYQQITALRTVEEVGVTAIVQSSSSLCFLLRELRVI